jgi:modulator of FtsH protease HflK
MPTQIDFSGGKSSVPPIRFNPKMIYIGVVVLVGIWFLSGVYTVAPDEKAVILRFGRIQEIVDPGLHYHWPLPFETKIVRSVTKVYRQEIGFRTVDSGPPARYQKRPIESLMLTGDENIIDVEMVVQYRVRDIVKALFNVKGLGAFDGRNAGLVHKASESALRQVIGRHRIDEALTEGKLKIQTEIREKLQQLFDRYECGLGVETVQLQAVSPPKQVDAAFKDVASAKEDRERTVNEARGYQNDLIPKTRGEAEKLVREAEAYREQRIRRASGDAERFLAVWNEYKKAPKVTEQRLYIETMEKILPKARKYIIDSEGQGGAFLNVLNLDKGGN